MTPRELDDMRVEAAALDLESRRRARFETAIHCTYVAKAAGNRNATVDSVYSRMKIAEDKEAKPTAKRKVGETRHYSGTKVEQIDKHIKWLEAKKKNASNH